MLSFGKFLILMSLAILPLRGQAQDLQALARLMAESSFISARASGDVDVQLRLTQAVPYRIFTLDDPARIVLDFQEVNFDALRRTEIINTDLVTGLRFGVFRPGWSRLVLELFRPMQVFSAEMATDTDRPEVSLSIRLTPQDPEQFTKGVLANAPDLWALPVAPEITTQKSRPLGDRPIVVALDPGHGGIDPGAQYEGHDESDLMLMLAREAKEILILSGRYDVFLTREEDSFLSLPSRVSKARAMGADVFLSFHADALAKGRASGTTVYTLSASASDAASAALAAGHERSDLLAGVDLSEQDDEVAEVLMDMVRVETMPRSEKLADAIVRDIASAVGQIRSRPRLSAGFSVLKAPDIPSVLIEFGFMSNPGDLHNLLSPSWRDQVIAGLVAALDAWSLQDAAEARLLRK